MLKLSGSFYKLLFATLLVFFCLNGHQLVYAEDLKLDNKNVKATVEVPKVSQTTAATSGVANPSTVTHSFEVEFKAGDEGNYKTRAKSFTLAIGESCKIELEIQKPNELLFLFNRGGYFNKLKSFTITNEKVIANSDENAQTPGVFCDPKDQRAIGGSVKFEDIEGDSSKSTIKLEITGDDVKDLPDDFELTSKVQVQKAASEDSNSGGGLGTGAIVGIVVGIIGVVGVIGLVIAGVIFGLRYLKKKKNNNDGDEMNDEPEKEKEPKGMVKKKEESIVKKTVEAQKTEEKV